MRIKNIILLTILLTSTIWSQAQQINPVPDYVFRNQMSVGRNAVTDTGAYFSIGPRYGANKGMMPPMVVDTASFSANKRNGLLIFSVQKNKFLYWDSVGVKWAEMAGTGGSAITGSGVAGYMPEFTTTTNLDTTRLYHSAGRFAIGSTTTTNGVFNVYGGQSYFDTSLKVGSQTFIADEGKNEIYINTTTDLGSYSIQNSGNHWMSGNLTIGTDGGVTSNLHRIEVSQDNPTRGILAYYTNGATSSQTGSQLTFHQGNVAYWSIGQPAATNAFAIWEGRYRSMDGTQLLRLESNGNLSLGQGTMQWTAVGRKSIEFNGTSQVLIGMNINGAQSGYIWQNGNDMSIQAPSSGYVQLGSGGTSANRLRLTSSGEVLINTESDAGDYKLQVSGNIYNTGSAVLAATSGDVGIGTSSPTQKFHVSSASNTAILAQSTTTFPLFILTNNNGVSWNLEGGRTSNSFGIYQSAGAGAGSTYFNIRENGRVGINTTTDSGYQFDVNGTLRSVNGANFATTSGEVLIGTTSDAGDYKLQVSGDIYNTGSITTGAPSGGSIKPWKIGEAATVSPTSPNRTIRVEIDGVIYYLHAKTTND